MHHDHQEGFGPSASTYLDLDHLEPLETAGAAPAGIEPQSETARVSARAVSNAKGSLMTDYQSPHGGEQVSADNKRFATLRAWLAIAGYRLTRTNETDGAVIYQASRWGMARMLDSLVDVESFAARVGATR